MRVRIKFCGITNTEDALAAAALGVDALGFVFHPPSPRFVTASTAAAIAAELPPFVCKVGLFVNATSSYLEDAVAEAGIDVVQFHGDETPAQCRAAPRPWYKAIRVRPDTDLAAAAAEFRDGAALLLDAWDEEVYGGSGRSFDWQIAGGVEARRVILAGGLTPDNVAAAIRVVRPYAVDVSGGIEARKGRKDHAKMHRFVFEVNNVERRS